MYGNSTFAVGSAMYGNITCAVGSVCRGTIPVQWVVYVREKYLYSG